MNRLHAPVLLVAILSILYLAFLSPKEMQPYQIGRGETGREVLVSGIVLEARQIKNGTIARLYNYSTIDILLPQRTELLPGDLLSARGKVTQYKGAAEIAAESAEARKPAAPDMQIGEITDRMVHKTARISGQVKEKKAGSFKLADGSGEIFVFAAADFPDGAAIELEGLVERYKSVLYMRPREVARLS